jgi:hypothetical protein
MQGQEPLAISGKSVAFCPAWHMLGIPCAKWAAGFQLSNA